MWEESTPNTSIQRRNNAIIFQSCDEMYHLAERWNKPWACFYSMGGENMLTMGSWCWYNMTS